MSVLLFLYDSCAHSQGEKFYFLCTFLSGESLREDAYTKGEKSFLTGKPCFALFFFMFIFFFYFMVL